MQFVSNYVSHKPDAQGIIQYSPQEHYVWKILYERQMKLVPGRACDSFLQGLHDLGLSADAIPQLPDLSRRLQKLSGWQLSPVDALISARDFFELLAKRHFPAATFIRFEEELDYVKEPDIFHELFGHCPMLTDPHYAEFLYNFAHGVLKLPETDWALMQRLFWFTVEFGLIHTPKGMRAYGGGILSSIRETVYSVEDHSAMRVLFEPVPAFRTPYRIDQLQPIYFVVDDFQTLHDFLKLDVSSLIQEAHALGEYPPLFPVEKDNPNIHIFAC